MVAVFAAAPSAPAVNWDGGGVTSEWLEAANWQLDTIPSASQSAVIVNDTATITGTGVPTILSLALGSGSMPGGLTMTGTSAPASLSVGTSATVAPAGTLALGGGGPATSQLSAASLTTAGSVSVQSRGAIVLSGAFTQTGGTVSITGGTLTAGGVLSEAGLFEATGVVNANVKIGDNLAAEATLSPGPSIGTLAINGNLSLNSDARLKVQFRASMSGGQFDAINVSGAVTLGGVLDLSIIGTGQPTPGTVYPVLTAGSIVPNPKFDDIVGLPTNGGSFVPKFDVLTNGIQVSYTVLRGDMNGDFAVNDEDVEKFAWAVRDGTTYHQHFVLAGNSAFASMADMDLDGDRTWADIPLFLDAVALGGGSVQAASATLAAILTSVPEPSAVALALAAGAIIGGSRRRSRRSRHSTP